MESWQRTDERLKFVCVTQVFFAIASMLQGEAPCPDTATGNGPAWRDTGVNCASCVPLEPDEPDEPAGPWSMSPQFLCFGSQACPQTLATVRLAHPIGTYRQVEGSSNYWTTHVQDFLIRVSRTKVFDRERTREQANWPQLFQMLSSIHGAESYNSPQSTI